MTKHNFKKRIIQITIIIAHLLLLYWIMFALNQGGGLSTKALALHFIGMAMYGAFLIRGTAFITKRDFLKEQAQKNHATTTLPAE